MLGCPGGYCRGGEGCIFSVREDWKLGKLTCCFFCAGARLPAGLDRRGRRRSSEEEVWDVGMSWRLLSGRRGLYIFSQGGLEAGKTDVLFFLCRSTAPGRAGPPWQTAVLEVRCLVQVLFMRRGFEKPPALYKANCVPLSCGMYCPAGTGKVPGHSPPVCVFLSSIQTLSGSLYKKHTEISQIQ